MFDSVPGYRNKMKVVKKLKIFFVKLENNLLWPVTWAQNKI